MVSRELGLWAIFALAAVAFTWPLVCALPVGVGDLGDPLLNVWILEWDQYALTHRPLDLFDANTYYPAKYPLAYSENMLGIAILTLPFYLLGLGPITVYNIALLMGFVFSAWGASVLARTAGASMFAAILCGLAYAFAPFHFDHLSHLQIIWSGWLPLIMASLFNYWRTPTTRHAAWAGLAFLGNGLTNIYFLLFSAVAVFITLAFFAVATPRRSLVVWAKLGVAFVTAGLLLYPILHPYQVVSKLYNMRRGWDEVASSSAELRHWFASTSRSRLWGRFEPPGENAERRLFPGGMRLAMALAALLLVYKRAEATPERRRGSRAIHLLDGVIGALLVVAIGAWLFEKVSIGTRAHVLLVVDNAVSPFLFLFLLFVIRCAIRVPIAFTRGEHRTLSDVVARSRFPPELWCALFWIVLGVLGSFGLSGWLHVYLYRHFRPFQGIRAVGRWAVIAYVGLTPWMAYGIDAILERRGRFMRPVALVMIALLTVVDLATSQRWENPASSSTIYRWIASEKLRGPLLELPMEPPHPFFYMIGATEHHQPLMNGQSGFEPPLHQKMRDKTQRDEYDDELLGLIESNGCRYLVVHGHSYASRAALGTWLRRAMAAGRLAVVRRFEHGVEGDYLFGVTANAKDWKSFVRPGDAASLERYLQYLPVYNAATFGVVEFPPQGMQLSGPLRVSGWALSPNGIDKIDVEIFSGSRKLRAVSVPRPDINAAWPWYGKQKAGFSLTIRKRPKRFPRDLDVQVVITDKRGNVTRLPDQMITWD